MNRLNDLNDRQREVLKRFIETLRKYSKNRAYALMSTGSYHEQLLKSINSSINLGRLSDVEQEKVLEIQKKIVEIQMQITLREKKLEDLKKMVSDDSEWVQLNAELHDLLWETRIISDKSKKNNLDKMISSTKFVNTQYLDAFKATSSGNIFNLLLLINDCKISSGIKIDDFGKLDSDLTAYFYKYRGHDFELSSEELMFFKNFMDLKLFLHHSTELDPNSISTLYSRKTLLDKEANFNKKNTMQLDIERLNDVDFVFFYLNTQKNVSYSSRFGDNKISIPVDKKFFEQNYAYMTFDDYAASVNGSEIVEESRLIKNIVGGYTMLQSGFFLRTLGMKLHQEIKYHAFMGSDILKGLALLIIYFRRMYISNEDHQLIEDLDLLDGVMLFDAKNKNSLIKLNALMNGWIRPIIKIPRGINLPTYLGI